MFIQVVNLLKTGWLMLRVLLNSTVVLNLVQEVCRFLELCHLVPYVVRELKILKNYDWTSKGT